MTRALITGAASGIGLATARLLAAQGVEVYALDLSEFPDRSLGVIDIRCDVSDRDSVRRAVFEATSGGEADLDMVVTSAGIYGRPVTIDELSEHDLQSLFGVNLIGTIWTAQATLPGLRRTRGSLVCIGSLAARIGALRAGPHYATAKGAIHSLTRTLAKAEARHGVRVNAVAPGPVSTPMIEGLDYETADVPLGRLATARDIADAIGFLLSPQSAHITGITLDVNGGVYSV